MTNFQYDTARHQWDVFISRIVSAGGAIRFESAPHPTREAACQEAFKAFPRVRSCSTSRGHKSVDAEPGAVWRFTGSDMQWHDY